MTELHPILKVGNLHKTYCRGAGTSDICVFLYDLNNGGYGCRLFVHHFPYNNFNPKRLKKCKECELIDTSKLAERFEEKKK